MHLHAYTHTSLQSLSSNPNKPEPCVCVRVFVVVHEHRWFSLSERLPLLALCHEGPRTNHKLSLDVIINLS